MPKPWARIEIDYMSHPKFLALNANAICLWHEGKNYCDARHTDGYIPRDALKTFRFAGKKAVQMLLTSCGPRADGTAYAPLWSEHTVGYRMHDYLNHNDCRDEVLARIARTDGNRDWDRRRKQLSRDYDLISKIRARDGDACRYCGRMVCWHDRRGPNAGTYDHIEPRGENTLENVVVACRGCNSVKGARTPAEAGMVLRPVQNQAGPSPNLARGQVQDLARLTSTEPVPETETNKKEPKNVSAEPLRDSAPPLLMFATVGTGPKNWGLTEVQITRWRSDYPNVDILAECRKAHAYLDAKPQKRKTAKGMPAFLVNWFNRCVERGGSSGLLIAPAGTEGRGRTGAPNPADYDVVMESD